MKEEVYQVLREKGLQDSFFTDDCPLAQRDEWEKCPFYESNEK